MFEKLKYAYYESKCFKYVMKASSQQKKAIKIMMKAEKQNQKASKTHNISLEYFNKMLELNPELREAKEKFDKLTDKIVDKKA